MCILSSAATVMRFGATPSRVASASRYPGHAGAATIASTSLVVQSEPRRQALAACAAVSANCSSQPADIVTERTLRPLTIPTVALIASLPWGSVTQYVRPKPLSSLRHEHNSVPAQSVSRVGVACDD